MAEFPGSIPTDRNSTGSETLAAAAAGFGHAALHNFEVDEIVALATKLGTGSSSPSAGTVLRGTGAGTSAYGQASLTTDVAGTLPVANGGTGTTSLTFPAGPDTLVSRNSTDTLTNKTLTAPTISDFSNATHDHTSTAEGGTLGAGTVTSTQLNVTPTTDGNSWDVIDFGAFKMYTKRFSGLTAASVAASDRSVISTGNAFPSGVAPADVNVICDGFSSDGDARWKFFVEAYNEDGAAGTTFSISVRNLTTSTISMTDGELFVLLVGRP